MPINFSSTNSLLSHLCLFIILLCIETHLLSAAEQQPGPPHSLCNTESPNPKYAIKSLQSRVHFNFKSLAAFNISGIAENVQGYINYSHARPGLNFVCVVLKTNDIVMDNPFYDRFVKGESFLYAEQFPEISFISDWFELTENNNLIIHGTLTLRGISRTETLIAVLSEDLDDKNQLVFSATTSILRSNYGMNAMRFLIANEIHFNIEVIGVHEQNNSE